jgi:hypothetical protein
MQLRYSRFRDLRRALQGLNGSAFVDLPRLPKRRRVAKFPGDRILPPEDRSQYIEAFLRFMCNLDLAKVANADGDSSLLVVKDVAEFFQLDSVKA